MNTHTHYTLHTTHTHTHATHTYKGQTGIAASKESSESLADNVFVDSVPQFRIILEQSPFQQTH